MNVSHRYYSSEERHRVLVYYTSQRPRPSLSAVARHFNINGGHQLIQSWYDRWDGTASSLETKAKSGRRRKLSELEVHDYVGNRVRAANRAAKPIDYNQIHRQIQNETHKNLSVSTVRRYGKSIQVRGVPTVRRTSVECILFIRTLLTSFACFVVSQPNKVDSHRMIVVCVIFRLVSKQFCDDVKVFRDWAKRINKHNLLFLDETYLRVGETSGHTLVIQGEAKFVESSNTSRYAPRYDMIACCSGNETLPPIIFSPEDRKGRGVQGVTSEMVLKYIDSVLAQAVRALDRYPIYLVVDQSTAHNKQRMIEAFRDRGCGELVDIVFMPAQGAKRLSPLDNGIFGTWKNRCRSHAHIAPTNIVHVMSSEWSKLSSSYLMSCYQHCALTHHRDAYLDCPLPASHRHENS